MRPFAFVSPESGDYFDYGVATLHRNALLTIIGDVKLTLLAFQTIRD